MRDRRISRDEEKRLLDAALAMNTWEHRYVGPLMHDRIIGALELCCRRGEMLLIQNKRVDWETLQIGIPGHTTKDKENRRIPFDPEGRLVAILRRRASLGPNAFVFGTESGEYQDNMQTAWDTCGCSRPVTRRVAVERVTAGTASSCRRSTCTGTTCATRVRAGSSPMVSTSASSS